MDTSSWKTIANAIPAIREVEEQFAKIQENPALYGAENGFTAERLELLNQLITLCGETSFAGKEIMKRALAKSGGRQVNSAKTPDTESGE
jgi:hypothetical protein